MTNRFIRSFILLSLSLLTAHLASGATFIWNIDPPGANNWNVNANWDPATGNPGAVDTALFGIVGISPDSFTVNNVVSVNTTITALSYTNNTAATWHVTQIPASTSLRVTGNVIVGGGNETGSSAWTTSVAMTGNGTFVATGTPFTIGNNATAGSIAPGTLDLSALDSFVYEASGGTISIGTLGSRSMGNLTLAAVSNSITAGTINMQGAGGTATGTQTFSLGGGTNRLNVGTFNLGGGRPTTTLQFLGGSGGWRLRGTGGTDSDRTTMLVGDRNVGGTGLSIKTTTGNMFLNGHPVDLKFSTLTLGRMSRTQGGSDAGFYNGLGILEFDQGTVDATTINLAVCSGNSTNSLATGTLTVGAAGTLLAGNISLVNVSSAAANVSGSGTLNIIGGEVTCVGNITKTTATGAGTITVSAGRLRVLGRVGSSAIPVDNLEVTDATLTLAASATVTNVVVTNLTTGGSTNIINISSVPAITGYPSQFPVIAYTGAIGGVGFDNNIGLGSLPLVTPSFQGYLSNNTANSTIDLVITNGPPPAQPLTWTGLIDGAWETAKLNWRAGVIPTNYNNAGDFVTFDDTASTSTVYLVTSSLTPGSITVNNSLQTYTFTGSGKLSGSTGLTKQGAGTLILDNSGVNDFSGNILLTGTLLVGTGGTSGNLPAASAVANNGMLEFNRSDNFTQGNAISGTGAITKNGQNTVTLTGANSFGGGLTVNAGVIRLNAVNSGGSGAITVNSNATVVFSAAQTNAGIVLAGGTFGSSLNLNPLVLDLTAAPGTTSLLYMADPQNLTPADGNETAFTGTWHGSGHVIVATVPNDPSPDGGNGFRLRGTAPSDFSGTLTLSNRIKGELQTSVAGPFSPAGTGKLALHGGVLTNNSLTGTYSELNLRNNSPGNTVFGNDVELAGTGLAVLDPLGSAPAGSTITMGNLRMGGGQELGVNLNGTGPDHPVVFQTVTLTGGNATFSPKTPGWNTTPQIGSDLSLADISQTAASSITMNGLRTLFITGTSTHSGSTTVSNGTLHLSGSLTGGGALTVAGGSLTGNGSTTGSLTVHPAGVVAPGASVGKFTAGGAVALQGTNVMEIDRDAGTNDVLQGSSIAYGGTLVISNLTGALQAGDSFKLYNATSYSGSFNSIEPATPGAGLLWNTSGLTASGTLSVVSEGVAQPYIASIVLIGSNLVISGTNATPSGDYYVLSSTDVALPISSWISISTNLFGPGGEFSFTNAVNPNEPQRFYLLQVP